MAKTSTSERLPRTATTIVDKEARHFGQMAADWWDPNGKSAMLHKLNPVRLAYVRDMIDMHWQSDEHDLKPLAGKTALDVGCGAGLLAEPERPTGVFAMSDEMAMGAIKAVRAAGLGCPEDVSIIGIDDHDLADFAGLTTIRQPVVDHGAVAARLLLRRMAEPDAPIEVHLAETTLVVRSTTGQAP